FVRIMWHCPPRYATADAPHENVPSGPGSVTGPSAENANPSVEIALLTVPAPVAKYKRNPPDGTAPIRRPPKSDCLYRMPLSTVQLRALLETALRTSNDVPSEK